MFFLVLKTSYCWCIFCTTLFLIISLENGKMYISCECVWAFGDVLLWEERKTHIKECLNSFVCTPIDCQYCAWLWHDFLCKTLGVPAVMTQIQASKKKKVQQPKYIYFNSAQKRKTNKQQHKCSREIFDHKRIHFNNMMG